MFKELKIGYILLTGPLISAVSYNLISLIFKQRLSSVSLEGYLILAVLALIPFVTPLYFFVTSGDSMEPGKSQRRTVQAKVSYAVAIVLSLVVYFFSAFAEEGPYIGGGAAMSLIGILFYGMPGTTVVTLAAGVFARFLSRGQT